MDAHEAFKKLSLLSCAAHFSVQYSKENLLKQEFFSPHYTPQGFVYTERIIATAFSSKLNISTYCSTRAKACHTFHRQLLLNTPTKKLRLKIGGFFELSSR